MTIWTDIITPAALTGYARQALADRERAKGTLARWLPNKPIPDIVAKFVAGANGLIDAAEYRAYDAETSIGDRPTGKRITIELPPLGRKDLVTEYEQLRLRGGGTIDAELALRSITKQAAQTAGSIGDKAEIMRGKVLDSGKATIDENGFIAEADYGRSNGFNVTAGTLWTANGNTPLSNLRTWRDVWVDENGEEPGAILTSRRVVNALMASAEIKALATTQATAPSVVTQEFVNNTLSAYGLPPLYIFDRKARVNGSTVRILPDNKLYMLPEPTDPDNADGTDLGATGWGQTLESSQPEYGIEPSEQPGVAMAALRSFDPVGVWVHGAAISLPYLANANLSLAATVL